MDRFNVPPPPQNSAEQNLFDSLQAEVEKIKAEHSEAFEHDLKFRIPYLRNKYPDADDYKLFHLLTNTVPPSQCDHVDFSGKDSVEQLIKIWRVRAKIKTICKSDPAFRITEAARRGKELIERHPDAHWYIYFQELISSSPPERCDKWDFDGEDSVESWLDQKIKELAQRQVQVKE